MRYIVIVAAACIVPSLSLLAGQKKSDDEGHEPGSRITETLKGNFDQKLVIDHRKYDIPGGSPVERNFEDIRFTYPENVQLVPNIPVSPHTPKYTLVPVKKLEETNRPMPTTSFSDEFPFSPTISSDFQEEIDKIRIPHIDLPGFITDPPPITSEEYNGDNSDDDNEDEDEDSESNEDEVSNHDEFFTKDFLEPPEFRESTRSTRSPPISLSNDYQSRDVKVTVHNSHEPGKPIIVTKTYPALDDDPSFDFEDDDDSEPKQEEPRQIRTPLLSSYQTSNGNYHMCNEKIQTPLRHYGPPKPMPPVSQFRSSHPSYQRQVMQRIPGTRVYVRYPRNYKTYYHYSPTSQYNKFKVMTQNFVQHPRNSYRFGPSTTMAMGQFRSVTTPVKKKKKKKKGKGQCKPKKIIKEIHFHHYDPQLSEQLAPLEGINVKEGEDYESDIKVITKETDIEDVKKALKDYEEHNKNDNKEKRKRKKDREQRLNIPEYQTDSYSHQYSDSGSTEYINYNINTDSQTSLHEPHPAHDYPQNDRSFKPQKTPDHQRPPATNNQPYSVSLPLQRGTFVKHEGVNYFYRTPDSHLRVS
ncbi:uncharacterized protein LOC124358661 [Homalodisca vitripennis]|uniref:uncharacterized protein LOC124358661 n=1 Tax=Homalodisca vitripennis TaxID=197043 RepID=UPI001EEB0669|nr:uncharacterized protein LOC124358661 [Homalodisca vitripennis]